MRFIVIFSVCLVGVSETDDDSSRSGALQRSTRLRKKKTQSRLGKGH